MSSNVLDKPTSLGEPGRADSADKILDILNQEPDSDVDLLDDKETEKPEGKLEKPKKEDDKEDKEEDKDKKDELELDTQEDDEFTPPEYEEFPTRQEILKEYPDVFKKFPALQSALYRNRDFSEIFPTIQEAKDAKARIGELEQVEQEVLGGSIEGIITAVKQQDNDAFLGIVDNFLPTLAKADPNVYYGFLNRVIGTTLHAAAVEAKRRGGDEGEQLFLAAQYISHFVTNSYEIKQPPTTFRQPKDDKREQEYSQKEMEFAQRQLEGAVNDVSERTTNLIRVAIEKNIDPKEQMTEYNRKNAIRDVMVNVKESIAGDKRFTGYLDSLWREAQKDGFSRQSVDKIRGAILNKAKNILPNEIRKARADALKGSTLRSRKQTDDIEEEEIKPERRTSTSSNARETSINTRRSDGRRKSTLEILNED